MRGPPVPWLPLAYVTLPDGSHRRHAMRVASHSCMLCVRQAALLLESQDYDDVVEAFEGQRSSTVLIALWPVLVISN